MALVWFKERIFEYVIHDDGSKKLMPTDKFSNWELADERNDGAIFTMGWDCRLNVRQEDLIKMPANIKDPDGEDYY